MNVAIFIDTQHYLDLYRLVPGKKLLAAIEEQQAHIFITAQITDEVLRNKLTCASEFVSKHAGELNTISGVVPDLLLGITGEEVRKFRQVFDSAAAARKEITKLAETALARIGRSEDEISGRLTPLFGKAVSPSPQELERARARKEKGDPPGKFDDPLGDQINWEQLLTKCRQDNVEQLWIISRDGDYGTTRGQLLLLNPRLQKELRDAFPKMKVHTFSDVLAGIADFAKTAGAKADKLPTPEETTEIRKEIETLPPRYLDYPWLAAVLASQRRRSNFGAIAAALGLYPDPQGGYSSTSSTPLPLRVQAAEEEAQKTKKPEQDTST